MKYFLNNLLLYFQFFTRIPINKSLDCDMKNFRDGAFFFPVIGLFIGALQYGLYRILINFIPGNIVAVIVLTVPIIVTGGLHVDGLGDTCDGFFSFKGDKEKIMEVMKDSRVGTFASIAIVVDILLRYTAISTLISTGNPYMLIAAPIVGRFTVVFLAFIGKSAKKNSSANIYINNIDVKGIIIATLITFLFIFKLISIKYTLIIIVASLVVSYAFNLFCNNKIGGLNGDNLGANYEIIDVFSMILYIALVLR
ncbi:adenosylcobinamide-GDP ribazoletransferase [Hathewaya histolytica]|uniref:Adenosylcobinamide-GDP ribazoletransferase n=1 Tax=Hathewaya histolytica TaxID=1498 RepID=A0A4U9R4W1_HATHI|nr:adenosylcobinamide-GDP ribazoletransferase [Hathewaya histolytica]VTQ86149.1 cobalamin synthase [Hathewaya histolytica]